MFGMLPKRKPLFQMPYRTPGIGDGVIERQQAEMSASAPQMAPEPQKGGFLAPGGTGRAIAGTVGDFLLQYNDMDPIYQPQMQYQQVMAERQRQASLEREQGWQDYLRKAEYERANPKPVNNDTVADYEFIRERLGEEAAAEYLKNKANPPQYRVGPDGQFYRIDVAEPPKAPVGKLTPLEETGGSNAAPTFPR